MNFNFYPLRALLFSLLLLGFKAQLQAQTTADFLFEKKVRNFSSGGSGASAFVGQILIYTIEITNQTTQNFVASKLYDNVPYGVSYIANTTRLNGVAVADVSGKMPYSGSGGYVNSPSYGIGILAPAAKATIEFQVRVTANGGNIFNNATLDATKNGVATIVATNTVKTIVTIDAACNVVYQVTTEYPDPSDGNGAYSYFRRVDRDNGTGDDIMANGYATTPQTDLAANNNPKHENAGGSSGGVTKVDFLKGCAAIAYDRDSNRIYFVNNTNNRPRLSYYDIDDDRLYRTGEYLEPTTDDKWNVNRMGKGSDGWFYALTSEAQDLIRFRILPGNDPDIYQLGALINAATNGSRNVLSEKGGDLFADGTGKLYLIANSSNMYKINPATRIATFMGRVIGGPSTSSSSQSLAIDAEGQVFINGNYQDVYKVNLQTMQATKINSNNTDVYTSGDYTACGFPVLASSIIADKAYKNINGSTTVNGGDTVVYTITVQNIGNINAAGVYMYDYIPPSTIYISGTTKMNGIPVADVGGVMPFAVSGGRLVKTAGEDDGIIKPGLANAAVVTFEVVTEPNKTVCNQSRITLLDADGNVMFVNSNDPTNVGQTPTCFYSDGVLPLTNLKFKGTLNDTKSVLNWTMTGGDENVDYYQVEYSDNGTAFYTAGKVTGKGVNTAGDNTYQFVDNEHTFAPVRYYRLKVYHKGGSYTYSGILKLNANDLSVEAAPNPFDRDINVQIKLKTAEQVRIRLIDLLGKEIYSTTEKLSIGTHSLSIRIPSNLTKGMYILDVKAGSEQVFTKKLIKK